MKIWLTIIGAILLTWSFGPGCGGGSGTGSGTGTGGFARYAVEATVGGSVIDPTNIVQGETVQFVVAGYTASNQRSVVSSSGWQADPTGQSEGTMSANGTFTATASGGLFTVSATADGSQRNGTGAVKPAGQALVTGRLIDGIGDLLSGFEVDFYDGSNALVGSSITQFNGTFRASVPATAVTFDINRSTIPATTFYREYHYVSKWYLPKPNACNGPLPVLSNGHTSALNGDVTVPPSKDHQNPPADLPPPPPPSAC
ncbi:MAG: hypothetical protein ACHQ50_17295 [Fimbriimonadales bacterium]